MKNSYSEDNGPKDNSNNIEKFIPKGEKKDMNKQVKDMKDTNRYLWSSKNKIERENSFTVFEKIVLQYLTLVDKLGMCVGRHKAYKTVSERNLFMFEWRTTDKGRIFRDKEKPLRTKSNLLHLVAIA